MAKINAPKTYAQTKVAQGGLMRCCLATIDEYVATHADQSPKFGLILDCKYEKPGNAQVVLDTSGIWRWNRPDPLLVPKLGA